MSAHGITWKGDTEWRPKALIAFGGGGYELDTARVPWSGRAPLKETFVNGVIRFSPHPFYSAMYVVSIDDDQDPVFPTVTLNFLGCKLGPSNVPPVKAEDSLVQKSISVENLTGPGGLGPISFTGAYRTPRTKWTWFQTTRPDPLTPLYSGVRGRFSLASSIFNCYTISSTTTNTAPGTPILPSLAAKYLAPLNTKVITSDYTFDDVAPGRIWSCSCVSDRDFSR